MVRTWVLILALAFLTSCKSSKDRSGKTQQAELGQSADQEVAGETVASVACDCAQLIPIKFRPDFPRVSRPEVAGCKYFGKGNASRALVVSITPATREDQFTATRAAVQNRYVKIHDSIGRTLNGGGRAVVGVASEPSGLSRYAVMDLGPVGYIASVTEALTDSAAPAPGFPSYLEGLAVGVPGACPQS